MLAILRQFKVIPLLQYKELDINDALKIAETLTDAGLPILEIIFRRFSDSKAIREIATRDPHFMIGAGNILSRDQLLRCLDARAKFALAPGACPETIKEAAHRNIVFAAGACNPTDIQTILLNGMVDFQFFPAEFFGGVETLKAIIEPFEHLSGDIVVRGGITPDKVKDYLRIPQVAAVGVDWIVTPEYIANKNWDAIRDAAKQAIDLAYH